jgi:hypothetical protein
LEERQVGGVARRIPIRIGLHDEAQAHCRCGSRRLIEREIADLCAFDPAALAVGHSCCRGGRPLADAGCEPCRQELAPKLSRKAFRTSASVQGRLVPDRHAEGLH